jgi:hypothetical protein
MMSQITDAAMLFLLHTCLKNKPVYCLFSDLTSIISFSCRYFFGEKTICLVSVICDVTLRLLMVWRVVLGLFLALLV